MRYQPTTASAAACRILTESSLSSNSLICLTARFHTLSSVLKQFAYLTGQTEYQPRVAVLTSPLREAQRHLDKLGDCCRSLLRHVFLAPYQPSGASAEVWLPHSPCSLQLTAAKKPPIVRPIGAERTKPVTIPAKTKAIHDCPLEGRTERSFEPAPTNGAAPPCSATTLASRPTLWPLAAKAVRAQNGTIGRESSGRLLQRYRKSLYLLGNLEAAIGFEPMHRGFADLSLTTWVRRLREGSPLGSGFKYHARTDASIEAELSTLPSGIFPRE
jgi:hypothetical protein